MSKETTSKWLTSKEAMKALRVDACTLMHMREEGKLRFEKKGNAFFYDPSDISRHKKT